MAGIAEEEERTCEHCRAVHLVEYKDFPVRDRGAKDCLICGKQLMTWNGTRDYFDARLKTNNQGNTMSDDKKFLGESYRGCRVVQTKDGYAIIGVLVQHYKNKATGEIRDQESPIEVIYETKEHAESALSLGPEKLGLGRYKPL